MNDHDITCSAERITKFFDDELNDDEVESFERHLEDCSACRERIERHAAEPHEWTEARSMLGSRPVWGDSTLLAPRVTLPRADDEHAPKTIPGVSAILSLLAPTDDPRMLGRLGPYEISGVIGRGGMGVVLKGWDAALNRYVAIKLLAPELAASGAARRRFAREAQAAAAVVHENVIAIHGVAETDGVPYLVMPYMRGSSLQKRLDRQGPLELAEILRVGMQTAAGLAAAHAQGLIHRDVKPANILLSDTVERVKLTDFGLARAADDASLTRSGVIAGTPEYMSPEQVTGESIGVSSDLFSLGSVLYALCTGRPPFRAETSYGVLRRICESEPRPIRELNAAIPAWLDRLVMRLLAKTPADRYPSAEHVAQLLEQCLAHVQQPTAAPLPESLVEPTVSLGRLRLILAAGVMCLTLLVAALAWFSQSPDAPAARDPSSDVVSNSGESAPLPQAPPWDDGITEELQRLNYEAWILEQRTREAEIK